MIERSQHHATHSIGPSFFEKLNLLPIILFRSRIFPGKPNQDSLILEVISGSARPQVDGFPKILGSVFGDDDEARARPPSLGVVAFAVSSGKDGDRKFAQVLKSMFGDLSAYPCPGLVRTYSYVL